MDSIAIVGVGLIGGSFGLGLRKAGFKGPVLGVSSERSIEAGVRLGAVDRGLTLSEAARTVDVLYLSQPISGILATLELLGPMLRPGCLVTDAGSTKRVIVEKADACLPPGAFLGGHPMAGKESRGVEAADPDLFQDRTYVLTPQTPEQLTTPLASAFVRWTEQLGARPLVFTPLEHDRIVSFTSHLPQLASTGLAAVLADQDIAFHVAGTGLRDSTRLALSSFDIWRDIVQTNTEFIDHALKVYIDKLTELRDNLHTQHLDQIFGIAADAAAKIRR